MSPSITSPVFRFAPSPNGYLHLGHALSALNGYEHARRTGGRFLLRIEDIDTARCRPEYLEAIFEDLAWLGLTWEQPVLHQSEHFARYSKMAARLSRMGLLYPCFATRAQLAFEVANAEAPLDPDGTPLYAGLHKNLPDREIVERLERKEPHALRLDMDKASALAARLLNGAPLTFNETGASGAAGVIEAEPERWGDAVIVRKDTPTSYHLAVVADDALQGVTTVTRGADLFAATGLHRLLQVLLGLPEPRWAHHRLLNGPDGRKLAKSAGDTSLRELRSQGATPHDIRRMLQLG